MTTSRIQLRRAEFSPMSETKELFVAAPEMYASSNLVQQTFIKGSDDVDVDTEMDARAEGWVDKKWQAVAKALKDVNQKYRTKLLLAANWGTHSSLMSLDIDLRQAMPDILAAARKFDTAVAETTEEVETRSVPIGEQPLEAQYAAAAAKPRGRQRGNSKIGA